MGGPSVTVHIDRESASQFRRALVRQRLKRWLGITSAYVVWVALAIAVDAFPSWGVTVCLVCCGSSLAYGEARLLRREGRLPVGHDLVADFGDVTLRLHAPGFERELAYANFRTLDRDGLVMRLEDGTGEKIPLPSALFSPDAEAWFRRHAHPRDFVAEPLQFGWTEVDAEPDIDHRLAIANVRRQDLPSYALPFGVLFAVNAVLGFLVSAETAVLAGGVLVILLICALGAQYSRLRKRLEFQYVGQSVRTGVEGGSWVVESPNWRERIDPAELTYYERRKGVVFLRRRTAGEDRPLVFPEAWVAGMLSLRGSNVPSI